jgi:hypothetical protein
MQKSPGKSMVGDFDFGFFLLLRCDHNRSGTVDEFITQAGTREPAARN